MDNRDEVREFLVSRRARLRPEQPGLPAGSRRRVPGLRRSEVAALTDVSVEFYAKLERGSLSGVSHPSLQWTLDAITAGPAWVANSRLDVLAANALARAFYTTSGSRPPNLARIQFLDSAARRFYPDWDHVADLTVDMLRTEAGRNPHDKDLHDLVGEQSTRLLASWAASHNDNSESQVI